MRLAVVSSNCLLERSVLEIGPRDVIWIGSEHNWNCHLVIDGVQAYGCVIWSENVDAMKEAKQIAEFDNLEERLHFSNDTESLPIENFPNSKVTNPSYNKSHCDLSLFVSDCGSAQGTWINGERLDSGIPSKLNVGDILIIGQTVFRIEDDELQEPTFRIEVCNINKKCILTEEKEDSSPNLSAESIEELQRMKKELVQELRTHEKAKCIKKKVPLQLKPKFCTAYTTGVEKLSKKEDSKPAVMEGIGFSMLKKMGWSEGKGLGKNEVGISKPLEIIRKKDKKGIGSK